MPQVLSCRWKGPRRQRQAFTLIELVISSALMALVLTGAYACLNAGLSSQKAIEPRVDLLQSARISLDRLSADLRSACPLSRGAPFLGTHRLLGEVEADTLDFATHNYTPNRPGEGDYCETSYFLEKDPRTGQFTLFRRRNPTLAFNPLSGGVREELAAGLGGLRLEYYDGWDWFDSWGDPQAGSTKSELATPKSNMTGLPDAIRITLLFNPNSHPLAAHDLPEPTTETLLAFQTIVRLNLPSGGAGAGAGAGAASTPETPSAAPPGP